VSEEQALLNAIITNPGDDLPRLVYADWLDDRGGPGDAARSMFIRSQCRRHGQGKTGLGSVERILLRDFGYDWLGRWGQAAKDTQVGDWRLSWVWSRGFVARLRGPLAAFWEERECGRCLGQGVVSRPVNTSRPGAQGTLMDDCPAGCNAGRVSGPTAAFAEVVRRNPVEMVEVTDRNPASTIDGRGRWRRLDRDHPAAADWPEVLPAELWDCMGYKHRTTREYAGLVVDLPTEAAARQALSATLIRLARDGQGLGDSRP
jgi:uncharacterized protein (TIGR02996 family)